ncbi:MAG TPA: hypothetical protein VF110_05400 [Burkholderiales bacterium]|jgi:hypothetical protein
MRSSLVVGALLALAACTQVYFKDFAVEPQDRAYSGRAQYDDIKRYLLARKLRIVIETRDYIAVELEREDTLQMRLLPSQKVELTLVRRTAKADFTEAQLRRFREGLESRLREETGQIVTIRLVDERVRPITNIQ